MFGACVCGGGAEGVGGRKKQIKIEMGEVGRQKVERDGGQRTYVYELGQ